jgi:hypothetical protein
MAGDLRVGNINSATVLSPTKENLVHLTFDVVAA